MDSCICLNIYEPELTNINTSGVLYFSSENFTQIVSLSFVLLPFPSSLLRSILPQVFY